MVEYTRDFSRKLTYDDLNSDEKRIYNKLKSGELSKGKLTLAQVKHGLGATAGLAGILDAGRRIQKTDGTSTLALFEAGLGGNLTANSLPKGRSLARVRRAYNNDHTK